MVSSCRPPSPRSSGCGPSAASTSTLGTLPARVTLGEGNDPHLVRACRGRLDRRYEHAARGFDRGRARLRGAGASTVGTFLRSFTWGDALQLDAVSRHLLARAWGAGAGPGAQPLTIDLDSTICETYGLKKAGGSRFCYTHVRATTPCSPWPQAQARSCMPACGAARPTPPGAFLVSSPRRFSGYERPELEGRSPWGQTPASAATRWCGPATEETCASPSPSRSINACIRRSPPCRRRPGAPSPTSCLAPAWRRSPIPLSGRRAPRSGSSCAGYRPTRGVSSPSSLPAATTPSSATERGDTLYLEQDHRRHAEIENVIRDLKYGVGLNHLPSGKFGANAA